jgi:pyruvate formate lyase activating enzyme
MREALFYHRETVPEGSKVLVKCDLCPRACALIEGGVGFCRGRGVSDGVLYATNYAHAVSLAWDPIEKKPLYHFNPGTQILSLGPNSCNLDCSFCQNWQISQKACPTERITVQELANMLKQATPNQVAFTYSEPLMWYEYIVDFAACSPDTQIVLVTNAYVNEEPWLKILPLVKAVNIDLKAYTEEFYQEQCSGQLETVKRNIVLAYLAGVHVEITNLLIPGLNNNDAEVEGLAQFIANIDPQIPLHISAYRPCNRLDIPPTTTREIQTACDIASRYLQNVYAGNVYLQQYSRKK